MTWPSRLSLNLQTTDPRPLDEVLDACKTAGIGAIGLFRPRHLEPFGIQRSSQMVRASGIQVVVYANVGFWAGGLDAQNRPRTLEGNIEVLDEAVALGTDLLGVASGDFRPGDKDMSAAHERVVAGLSELAKHAAARNLRLGIEPVHPIYGPRAVYTLKQALDIADEVGDENVGVIVDTYHQWWEPDILEQLRRGVASKRIFLVQVCDWTRERARTKPFTRAVMGEGWVDFDLFLEGLKGYDGWFDIEILMNEELAALPMPVLIEKLAAAHMETIGRKLS